MKSFIRSAITIATLVLLGQSCRTPLEPSQTTAMFWITPDTSHVLTYTSLPFQLHVRDSGICVAKVLWDFGDGSGVVRGTHFTSHPYYHAGTYTATAVAFDSANHVVASASSLVFVTATSFLTKLTASADTVRNEAPVAFHVTVSPLAADYYIWSCQGQVIDAADLEDAQCTFHEEGNFLVRVLCYKNNEPIAVDSMWVPVRFRHAAERDLLRCVKVTSLFMHASGAITTVNIPLEGNTTTNGNRVTVQSVQDFRSHIAGTTVDSSVVKYTSFSVSSNGRYLLGHLAREIDSGYNEQSQAYHVSDREFGMDSLKLTYVSDDSIVFARPDRWEYFGSSVRDYDPNSATTDGNGCPSPPIIPIVVNSDYGQVKVIFSRR